MKFNFFVIFSYITVSVLCADIFPHVLPKYPNPVFVCTGVASGEIFARAIEANIENGSFSEAYGVEKDKILAQHSEEHVIPKYINDYKPGQSFSCKIFNRDPVLELANIIQSIDKTITFVLASQFPDWTTPEKSNLIFEELNQIKQHHIRNHTILIDYLDFCSFDLQAVKNKLLEINPNYKFGYENGGHIGKVKDSVLVAFLVD